jgi:hypothetical protein
MGVRGSGNWFRCNTRAPTASQRRIDVRWLRKQNYLHPGISGPLSWSCNGQETGRINFKIEENNMTLSYRHRSQGKEWEKVEQIIPITRTPCNYGGSRKWFLCPRCGKRVAVLYGAGKYFFCRCCYQLTYDSCNSCDLQRILNKSYKLKEKIGGEPILHSRIPDRPKWMHRSTYIRIVDEIYGLESLSEQGMIDKWGFSF